MVEPARLTHLLHIDGIPAHRTTVAIATLVVTVHLDSSPKKALARLTADDAIVPPKQCILGRRVSTDCTYCPSDSNGLVVGDTPQGRRGGRVGKNTVIAGVGWTRKREFGSLCVLDG